MLDDKALQESFRLGPINEEAIQMDVQAFDKLLKGHGVCFKHYRALPCPVGLGDRYDIRHTHDDHSGCSNGFIYVYAGDVVCSFTGNSRQAQILDLGMLTGSTVQVTVPRFYMGSEREVLLAPYDRLYLADNKAKVIATQRFEHHITGYDRMEFPVEEVELIVDSDGRVYESGDFEVTKGQVHWLGNNQPGVDPATQKGQVCSIRYHYTPFYYVERLLHEVRQIQSYDPSTGQTGTVRMPYAAVLQRENYFQGSSKRDEQAPNPNSMRQPPSPRSGMFGAR